MDGTARRRGSSHTCLCRLQWAHLVEMHYPVIGCSPINDCTTHLIKLNHPVIGRDLPPDLGHLPFVPRTKHEGVISLLLHRLLESGLHLSRSYSQAHGNSTVCTSSTTHLASGS